MHVSPFEIVATLIFVCALVHTLCTPFLYDYSKKFEKKSISYEVVSLLSQVEVAFALWLIPLLVIMAAFKGISAMHDFLYTQRYNYPLFMMIIVVVVASRPLIIFSEKFLEKISRLGGDSGASWWWAILTVTPLLGLIVKESGAMALAAILLSKKFYKYKPSKAFQYITLTLCLSNIAVAGLLMSFGTRALFIVYDYFEWNSWDMFRIFGWKALVGMIIANSIAYLYFRKEFRGFPNKLPTLEKDEVGREAPWPVTLIHLFFVIAIVLTSYSPILMVALFILYLAFYKATSLYQNKLKLRPAVSIGIFFASLLVYGELQGWWVTPFLADLNHFEAMIASFLLSAFLDNAVVNYFSVQLPTFDSIKAYFIVAGAMSSSAMTIVSNVPNAIAFSILRPAFDYRISFFAVFCYALFPAAIYLAIFWIFRHAVPTAI